MLEALPLRPNRGPWLLQIERDGERIQAVLKLGSTASRPELTTEAAALALADAHDIPAPKILAVDLEGSEGTLALLFTALPGSSDIPVTPTAARLRASGAAAAQIHCVRLDPSPELPLRIRHMAWIDLRVERRWANRYQRAAASEKEGVLDGMLAAHPGWDREEAREVLLKTVSSTLLDEADVRLASVDVPRGETVLVHGDLWQGNMMWDGDTFIGTIDWEVAGAGHPGVDLGAIRLDAAILFDLPAATEILSGWEEASGRRAENIPYWDVVTCLNTSADMSGFLPTIHQAGRNDLDGKTLTDRRDSFLRQALQQLGGN
ncbi:MAG: aminoglycoside phosphotransferase family protein [Actinobacteria bacterium]|nr:aminoglycoside phosphotransferase family protein [Actinomycetota bacterium]